MFAMLIGANLLYISLMNTLLKVVVISV